MVKKLESFLEWGGIKKEIVLLLISLIALVMSFFDFLPFEASWIAIVLCGLPIIIEAIIGLVTRFDIKADVLVSLALLASVFIGEYFAAGEIAFIMQLGALLEDLTVAKANAGIEKLIRLTPHTARVIVDQQEKIVDVQKVCVNDIVRVLPGEMIPVDGIILNGETSINQSVMTGESLPVDKTVGDKVCSGTLNQFGVFDMKATKVGEDSSLQRMIKLVQSADAGKAKIVSLTDRWATWIVVIALTVAILTWLLTGQLIRSVTILVVFCPCALVLATPTAIIAASGNATEHGFLVRVGDALERLAKVKKVTFDKTGTLTYGILVVTKVESLVDTYTKEELYEKVAVVESCSEHPLGKAIVKCYKEENGALQSQCDQFQLFVGKGVLASIDHQEILAGNQKLLEDYHISLSSKVKQQTNDFILQGSTVIYIAIDRCLVGYLVLTDTIRQESYQMIETFHHIGIETVLLTGDHYRTAETIANKLNILEFHAECLPEDKLKYIETCQQQNQNVCMIGDGINDAPALKKANVGIAMGGIGSDIAVDAADIVLVNDEIHEFHHLIALSQKMMRTIVFNLSFSMGLNFLAIILAMTGILNPVGGALVHNAGSVFVIINSAFLMKWRKR